ncbi:TPA: 4-oxalocrotonate tautomerase [Pseudomonas aeruginosa]|uniref:tautomerase family protein n=1 Tax=Pseudomonas aeruginosa TaxID=287 RepID=UPI0005BA44FD|nr:4-oxalocrotonate tautomerase [Pseudomonas aeruginosa]EKV3036307.1 4-oxalocrotonate tautomerase [Pseudomonas aeruginosa]EKV3074727.1 4-oxalocrotonate tautomerase [Pseudomonas aeruginosa]EKY0773330.1 4-oxalocrotonate tautomerase [Pseudomonas aeruginosa]KSD18974.1 4-oxalocrotonate tautomerase [Pseudomonas aeruginosa]KSP97022.1 4-oxalocrotonate tautomerase [Pseudomonas aeruginosa]
MPGITLQLSGQEDAALATRLASDLTILTCAVLDKRAEHTMVLVRFVPHELWFIDGRSLAEHGRNSFRLEVTITDETNTKAQKARYQREAFDLVGGILGNLHSHSNIHIIDCRAAAYGYGGVSQEYRHHNPEVA